MSKLLRIFAGPNGSGKSTIINRIRSYKVGGTDGMFAHFKLNADGKKFGISLTKKSAAVVLQILLRQNPLIIGIS